MNSPLRVVLWACLLSVATPVVALSKALASETSASMASIYHAALESNPATRAQMQRMDALNAGRTQANNLTAGPLVLEGSYRSDRNFDSQGLREMELGISVPIWLWNERRNNQQYRQAELEAGEHRFAQLKLDLAGLVRQAVWHTWAAQQDTEIAQARLLGSKKLLEDVQRRVDAGDLARADLLQATALHAQAKAEHGRALSSLAMVSAEFTAVTGLPGRVLTTQKQTTPREPLPEETALRVETHPTYLVLQSRAAAERSRADLLAVQKRNNPEVGLAIVNDRAGFAASNEKSLVLSTRIPLGASIEHSSQVLQARADETEAQAKLGQFIITLNAQASAALASVAWFEQLQTNAQEQAAIAQQVYALYQQSFSLGETDLPTLLRLEQQSFEAQRMAQKSTIEYSSKVSALRQALGLLPE